MIKILKERFSIMQNIYKQIEIMNKKINFLRSELEFIKFIKDNNIEDQGLGLYLKESDMSIKEKKKAIKNHEEQLKALLLNIPKNPLSEYINTITLGDCMNHLSQIPPDSVHLFVSDIPYGINLDEWDVLHNNTNSALLGSSPAQEGKSGFKRRGKPINGWNKEDRSTNKEYEEWVFKWAQQVFPVMKEGAPLFIFGARRTISAAITAFEKAGFLLKDTLAWEKSNAHHRSQDIFKVLVKRGQCYRITEDTLEKLKYYPKMTEVLQEFQKLLHTPYSSWKEYINAVKTIDENLVKNYTYELLEYGLDDEIVKGYVEKWKGWKLGNLAPYYEPIAWFMKPYDSVVTLTDNVLVNEVGAMNMNLCKVDGKEPKNILRFDFTKEELKDKIHEAQKPVELIKFLIKLTTQEEQVVLDPFVGSGTTAVACKELNRKFIAFEINEEYQKHGLERLQFEKRDDKTITKKNKKRMGKKENKQDIVDQHQIDLRVLQNS